MLASSALAASPVKGLPSPRAFCSLNWKPAARASPAAKIAALASPASDQRMRRPLTPTLRRRILARSL